VRSRKCEAEECWRQPSFGDPQDAAPRCCASHVPQLRGSSSPGGTPDEDQGATRWLNSRSALIARSAPVAQVLQTPLVGHARASSRPALSVPCSAAQPWRSQATRCHPRVRL
jgi:hypothetical protein